MDSDSLDLIVTLCHKLNEILLDPTEGKSGMSAEERTAYRKEAHDHLKEAIDTLGDFARYAIGFYHILDIADKFKLDVTKETNTK